MIGKFRAKAFLSVSAAATATLITAPNAEAQEAMTICEGFGITCLDQGWTDAQRAWWYTTTQGSRLLPLSWALALETADGTDRAFGEDHLKGLGYLMNPPSGANPFGLPVGFAVDHRDESDSELMCDTFPEMCREGVMREAWLGLNCSACHTNELVSDAGTRFRIDGAATMADFTGLVDGTEDALRVTLGNEDRFERFALSVLNGRRDAGSWESLRRQIDEQLVWMAKLRDANGNAVEAGPARLDAQGHILTKVSMVNGASSQFTEFQSDAPASYPFIWNTNQQAQLQWNGIASAVANIEIIPNRPTELGALIRNTSEVIGVFAQIEAGRRAAWRGYDSSVRVTELVGLERQLARLESPVWPEDILGDIDDAKRTEGRALFNEHCASCHAHLEPDDVTSPAQDQMTSLVEAGTDVFLACNTYLRQANAGNMSGQKTFGFTGDRIQDVDFTRSMLVNASVGAIVGKRGELLRTIFSDIGPDESPVSMPPALTQIEYLPGVVDQKKKDQARKCLTETHPLLAYKARPLNGVWATAPYLHNGSVPTLYDLLLPAKVSNMATPFAPAVTGETRPESFGVGGRVFDAENVGFSTDEADNPWVFNVRDADGNVIPGNSNAGHDYGNADFTDEERMAIVEYLKSL